MLMRVFGEGVWLQIRTSAYATTAKRKQWDDLISELRRARGAFWAAHGAFRALRTAHFPQRNVRDIAEHGAMLAPPSAH